MRGQELDYGARSVLEDSPSMNRREIFATGR